ncbi:hypothetical protein AAC387_Pa03g4484 [Persea americana]
MRMVLHLFVWVFLALAIRVHGQQEGFLSIDCGITGDLSYTDDTTQMFYTSDTKFIDTGTNKEIAATYMTQTLPRQYQNLRIFPNGTRNCYTLTPVIKSNRYLLRASFMYGNYDGLDQPPQFDAYLGVDRWEIDLPSNSYTESVVKAKEEVGSISQRQSKDGSLRLENQRFTYAEIIAITNNFETVIGEGGFGVVYHGYVKGAIQVAVKMLSKSSSQGSREFRTEASVLFSS